MIVIPLAAVPNQTLAVVLGGQSCQIALRQNGPDMFLDLQVGDEKILTSKVCRNKQRLLSSSKYLGFAGDLEFIDTQGDEEPQYLGLESRWFLVYLESGE